MIFYGVKALDINGLLTVEGSNVLEKHDWGSGEDAFSDVAAALAVLQAKACYGRYALIVSLDQYARLQRIQPGTGVLESERIEKLLGGRLFISSVLQPGTALLVCAESQYL